MYLTYVCAFNDSDNSLKRLNKIPFNTQSIRRAFDSRYLLNAIYVLIIGAFHLHTFVYLLHSLIPSFAHEPACHLSTILNIICALFSHLFKNKVGIIKVVEIRYS